MSILFEPRHMLMGLLVGDWLPGIESHDGTLSMSYPVQRREYVLYVLPMIGIRWSVARR